jgi:hypothetical protein
MHSDFDKFVAGWLEIATQSGVFVLPQRSAITVAKFQSFLPCMMLAKWDQNFTSSQVVYAGTVIDDVFQRDIGQSSFLSIFSDKSLAILHREITQKVVQDLVGAEVHADLRGGERSIRLSQVRLPIAPENGEHYIVSLFKWAKAEERVVFDAIPSVANIQHHFFNIIPKI